MNLDTALTEIAAFLDLNAAELIAYATEDTVGGFHFDALQSKWPGGSLWEVEGRTLYALVRALKPDFAMELGSWHGCSTTHLLAALNVNRGRLQSVDKWEGAGDLVPEDMRSNWAITYSEAIEFIEQVDEKTLNIELVFEDCIHSESEVYAIVEALKPKLIHGAVVVHHDSEHGDDGQQIRRALDKSGVTYKSWLIEPSDCGIAIWRAE